jgi:hypothetical protein
MVDLVVLQSVSYVAAAIGVCLAAVYYMLTLRTSQRNIRMSLESRKIELTNNILNNLLSEDSWKGFADVMNMEWSDFDDFTKKYDSTVNPELFAKRMSYISTLDNMGYLYKLNVVDAETVYEVGGSQAIWVYAKFKCVMEEYRKISWGVDRFRNLDYFAREMYRLQTQRDPSFKGDRFYFDSDDFSAASRPSRRAPRSSAQCLPCKE